MIPRFQVKKVMCAKLHAVPTRATARTIAQLMEREDIECLLVEQDGAFVGIVTDHDLTRKVIARSADPDRLTAQEIMSYPVASIEETVSLEAAHEMMGGQRVRHLLVTRAGEPVGVLSVRGLLDAAYDWALQMKQER